MRHQLEALRLPAAQRRAGLAELDVIQARVAQRLQRAGDFGKGREEAAPPAPLSSRAFAAMFRPAPPHLQRFRVEARAPAGFARHKGRRHETHLQFDLARPEALRTPPLRAVEGKPAGRIAAQARFRRLGEQPPDFVEKTRVGRRHRPRRCARWGIDPLHKPPAPPRRPRRSGRARTCRPGVSAGPQFPAQRRQQAVAQQRAFARTAHPRQADKAAQGKGHRQVLQIVRPGPAQPEPRRPPRPPAGAGRRRDKTCARAGSGR